MRSSLLFGIVLAFLLVAGTEANAVWWNTTFGACRQIDIVNSGAALTDYPVSKNITFDSDMKTDFSDIRFTNGTCTNAGTEISYWLEQKSDSSWANVWVKVPSIAASGNTTLAMYYNASVSSASNKTAVFGPNLISMWTLDGNAIDYFGGNNGTITGATVVSGRKGKAYYFDGNDDISLGDTPFDITGNVTYSLWVNVTQCPGSWADLIAKGVPLNNYQLAISAACKLNAGFRNATGFYALNTNTALPLGQWQHLILSWNGTHILQYVNGTLDATPISFTGAIVANNNQLSLGYGQDGYFRGVIDEVRVYNASIPVSSLYAASEPTIVINTEEKNNIAILNVSAHNNATGSALTNWQINITNGTAAYSATGQNNPSIFYNTPGFPLGNVNITISEMYFFNSTYSGNLNTTAVLNLNATLQPKSANPVSLTSSGGWSMLEGTITILTCSGSELTPQFTLNGAIVTNSYILTTQSGTYTAVCNATTETTNYAPAAVTNTLIVNPLLSCTNSNIFAFSMPVATTTNITTLNFTTLVSQNLVRSTMADVYVATANNTWINTTGGYYVIVNNTGQTSFTVQFGNYYVNTSHTTASRQGDVIAMTNYTQAHPYALYNVLDELTGNYFFPPNATVTSIVTCAEGETYIPVDPNDTKFIIATQSNITKVLLRVLYTADAYYSRQIYPTPASAIVMNFYVSNAYINALDRIDFFMQDMNHYAEKLQAYKQINGSDIMITEGYFDASHYFSEYLMEDTDYYLRTVTGSGVKTEFGRITIVAPAVKPIGYVTMNLNPQAALIADKLLMNSWMSTDRKTMYVVYTDQMLQTNQLNISVLFENGTTFKSANYTSTNSVSLTYNTTGYENQTFTVEFSVNHQTFGNSPVKYAQTLAKSVTADLGLSALTMNLFSLLAVVFVAGIASRRSVIEGAFAITTTIIILRFIGWLTISLTAVAFISILCVLGIIIYFKQGGE